MTFWALSEEDIAHGEKVASCSICEGKGRILLDSYDIRNGEHIQVEDVCECQLKDSIEIYD